jgi:hypothetical protein
MGSPLLHGGASVTCSHGGPATPAATVARVRVGGQPVVTTVAPYSVSACPASDSCVLGYWTTASARVRALGQPLVIADGQSVCAVGGTALQVLVVQQRVKAL